MSVTHVNFRLILCCFLLWSCDKELDYTFPLQEKIVVVGELSPQDGVFLQISSTIPNTENGVLFEDLIIEDANVFLETSTGEFHQIPHSGEGIYTLSNNQNIIIADSVYTIIIEHSSLGEARSAALTIPNNIIDGVTLDANLTGELWLGNTGIPEILLELSWEDSPNETNYLIQLDALTNPIIPLGAKVAGIEQFGVCQVINSQPPYGIYFDDLCFKNQNISIKILTGIRESVRIGDTVQTVKNLKLHLYSVDEAYVSYLNSQRPLETETGISEPERSFSNINNGLGIITAINKYEIVFNLPK